MTPHRPAPFVPRPVGGRALLFLAVLLVVSLAGCGAGSRRAADPFGAVPSAGETGRPIPRTARLEVSVQNRTDATIHVTARDDRRSQALGEVAAMEWQAFQARWTRRTDVSFLIRVDGTLACATRGMEVESGRTVVVTVDPARADAPGASTEHLACTAVVVS